MTISNYRLKNPRARISKAVIQDFGSLCYLFVYHDWTTKAHESVYKTLSAAKRSYTVNYQSKTGGFDKPVWELF